MLDPIGREGVLLGIEGGSGFPSSDGKPAPPFSREQLEYYKPNQFGFSVVRRSKAHCISALDSALAGFIPRMLPEDLPALREAMMANNETVMKEMTRRGTPPKTSTAAT